MAACAGVATLLIIAVVMAATIAATNIVAVFIFTLTYGSSKKVIAIDLCVQ
jgi:hypothetical protein